MNTLFSAPGQSPAALQPLHMQPTDLSSAARDEADRLGLTPRQYTLLVRLAIGEPMGDIARDLGISHATANAHLVTLCRRLGARDLRDAITLAKLRGVTLRR